MLRPERVLTSGGCFIARKFREPLLKEEKQMTVEKISLTGASSTDTYLWKAIHWPAIEYSVNRLQMRIAKAVQEGRHHKAQALQWLLTPSFQAKVLATPRVTENRGGRG
jgi:RNA-directed DNA polymerase